MKFTPLYEDLIRCKCPDEVFAYLISNLKETIFGWDYFVNWSKSLKGVSTVELNLNILNVLIGKENIEEVAVDLLREHPEVISTIPILLAYREKKKVKDIAILKNFKSGG